MIDGFDSFAGTAPLRYHFTERGDAWVAEIGFVGSRFDESARAVVQFTRVGGRTLPHYYCSSLLERRAAVELRLVRDDPEYTLSTATVDELAIWMSRPMHGRDDEGDSTGELWLDGDIAPDMRSVEAAIAEPGGERRLTWVVDGRETPIEVNRRRTA